MKIQDYHYEHYIQDEFGPKKIELTILRKDIKSLVDRVRDLQAKANRLFSEVDIFDRELDNYTLNEWQLEAQACLFDVNFSIGLLSRWQSEIIDYNFLIDNQPCH